MGKGGIHMRKKRKIIWILLLILCVVVIQRIGWIYWPSQGEVTFYVPETGETIRDSMTREEIIAAKKILVGHIRWPQLLYGYPACYYEREFSITIDGVCYMPAKCCDMVVAEDSFGNRKYMNVSDSELNVLTEMISSRGE
jgi:hypothetical protein